MAEKAIVAIIMGSESDLPVMQEASKILENFDIPYDMTIVSAHRTPDRMVEYAKAANENGIRVIIAGAGGSAHLPGMTAAFTTVPVIGVPIKTKNLDGVDSLLSIAQMPPGIPVATVAINGAKNAGLLAVSILALFDTQILQKLQQYRSAMQATILEKAKQLEKHDFQGYGGELGE